MENLTTPQKTQIFLFGKFCEVYNYTVTEENLPELFKKFQNKYEAFISKLLRNHEYVADLLCNNLYNNINGKAN
jgi:hypothetical protein